MAGNGCRPRHVRLPVQTAVAFIPMEQREQAERLLRGERHAGCAPCRCAIFTTAPCWGCTASNTGTC
jgi:DNA polymerase-2